MAKVRSPRYPAISLPDAIQQVEKLYNAEHRNAMSREVMAHHMGYSGLTGTSLPIISALSKYGLVDGRGDEIRVTTDAVIIICEAEIENQADRAAALNRALAHDSLFSELRDRFGPGASETNIAAHLSRNGFTRDAASKAARAFLESIAFVEEEAGSYNPPDESPSGNPGIGDSPRHDERGRREVKRPPEKPGMQQDTFNLDEGEVVLQWPKRLSPESLEDFEGWISLILRRAKRSVTEEESVPTNDA